MGWNIPESARRIAVEPPRGRDASRIATPRWPTRSRSGSSKGRRWSKSSPTTRRHPQPIPMPVAGERADRPAGRCGHVRLRRPEGRDPGLPGRFQELGLPLDAVLRVGDASGATIVEVDDARKGFDPEVQFTAPGDGTYRVSVRDLNGQGGPRYAYLLTAGPPRPDFALTLKADQFSIDPGQAARGRGGRGASRRVRRADRGRPRRPLRRR